MFTILNPFFLLGWGLIALIFYLHWRGYFKPKKFWFFGPFTSLVYALILLIVFMAGLNYLANSSKHQTFAEKLTHYRSKNDLVGELRICKQRDFRNPNVIQYQIALIDAYLKIPDLPEYWEYQKKRRNFRDSLANNSVVGHDCIKARANHLLMYWYMQSFNINLAKHFAAQKTECYSEGYYSMAAAVLLISGQEQLAYNTLIKAINLNPNPTKAFLFGVSNWKDDSLKIDSLLNHPKALKFANYGEHRAYFLNRAETSKYLYSLYFGILFRYHPFFVFISFLIVVSIGYYLYSIDVFDRDSLLRLFTIFLIGCAIVPLSLFFYDMYNHGWDWFSAFVGKSTWLNMTFAVGFNEELIKLIPFLVAVYVFKWANEPIDYIIYSAIGALSFAFLENTMYFQKTNGDVVFARTIFSTLGHIFDSSIIAYGLAYNRFKLKSHINSFILLPFLLLIASVAHGTYNTIASTSGAKSYLLMVPFMVFSMALLGGFLNNGMNNSPHFNKNLIASNDKSVNMIGTAFIMLYIIQQCIFIYISHNFDVTAARVLNTVGLVAILVIVMAYFLGTFDVVRGKWLNISEMIFKLRVNRNKALGLNCEIYTNNLSEVEHLTDYLVGHISDRVMVEGDDAIFLVKLKTPYSFNGIEYKSVLIRHINHRHKIISGVEFSVRFIVPVSKRVMLAKNNSRNSFEYAGDALLNVPKGLQQVDLNKITATTI